VRLFGIERQDLPRHFTISDNQGGNRLGSKAAHGFQAMAAIRSPESIVGRSDGDDRIKETSGLVDHIREPLVMGVRQISLKRSWFDSADRQNRKQQRMSAKRLSVGSNNTTTSFFDRFGKGRSVSARLVETAFAWA
jgi:hypothetical protein